jgi:hypothetical protein
MLESCDENNFVANASGFAFSRQEKLWPEAKSDSRRQPTDHTDLPAGFAALAAVGEKVVGRVAGARADLKELLARHAGFSENIAIEPA